MSGKTLSVILALVWCRILTVAGAERPTAPQTELTIRIYDYAQTPAPVIRDMKNEVESILEKSRVKVTWVSCKGADQTDRDTLCQISMKPSELVLRLRPSTDAEWLRRSPGASVGSNAGWTAPGGTILTVSVEAAERLAEQRGCGSGRILGSLVSHEIGHAFGLRHTALGIMKPQFVVGDLESILQRRFVFNARQTKILKQQAMSRFQAAARRAPSVPVVGGSKQAGE